MTVSERVVELLREQRQLGRGFEPAWAAATAQALAETTRAETWAEVLAWSKPAYRRAYNREPRAAIDWLEPLLVPAVLNGRTLVLG